MEEKSQRKLLLHCWCSLENSGLASFLWWRHVKAYDLVGYYSQMYYAYRRAWIAWKSKWCLNSSILLSNFPIKLNIWETKMFIVFKWSYIELASNILATWVSFTISATWVIFIIPATSVIFTISATSTVSAPIILHSWLNRHYNQIWITHHFFCPKVHFLRLFWGKNQKISNSPPPWKLQSFISRRRHICVDTVYSKDNYFRH